MSFLLRSTAAPVLALALGPAAPALGAAGQEHPIELATQVAFTRLSELDESDVGFGLRLAWRFSGSVALEGELNRFPGDLGAPAFSRARTEGLVGLKAGRSGEGGGVFATLRTGVVDVSAAPAPFACIEIFPPPLQCHLAGGEKLWAIGFGAAFELAPRERVVLRLDIGDQLLKYPGPVLDADGEARPDGFWRHNLRATLGAGYRF